MSSVLIALYGTTRHSAASFPADTLYICPRTYIHSVYVLVLTYSSSAVVGYWSVCTYIYQQLRTYIYQQRSSWIHPNIYICPRTYIHPKIQPLRCCYICVLGLAIYVSSVYMCPAIYVSSVYPTTTLLLHMCPHTTSAPRARGQFQGAGRLQNKKNEGLGFRV